MKHLATGDATDVEINVIEPGEIAENYSAIEVSLVLRHMPSFENTADGAEKAARLLEDHVAKVGKAIEILRRHGTELGRRS